MITIFKPIIYPIITMVPKVVFVLGGPGAGKGTQCQQIAKVCELHKYDVNY